MIPILNAEQMRSADAYTIAHEPISSIDLMERAALACVSWWLQQRGVFGPGARAVVVAGTGNNGGDGLAIARLLKEQGISVLVLQIAGAALSEDNRINRERCARAGVDVQELIEGAGLPELAPTDVLLDALFGTGLSRPIDVFVAEVVRWMNNSGLPIVSIDLPSGLFATDNSANDRTAIVRASFTLTFQCPKPALFLRENAAFIGQLHVLPIGLDADFLLSLNAPIRLLEAEDVCQLLPARGRFAHKGDHGHALLLAGSTGMFGAAVLATKACLRSGAGLVSCAVPSDGVAVIQQTSPSAMCMADPQHGHLGELPSLERATAVGIGPGIGMHPDTGHLLKRLIQEAPVPLVLDADALNVLSENPTWIAFLPAGTILTPHPKEFDRLAGTSANDHERLEKAREFARRNKVVLVLKSAYTATCTPDGVVHYNPNGGPGMAKGGSGDVLTGVITGLRAQGCSAAASAMLGVYLHGLAGDLVAARLGADAMNSADLVEGLPAAWQQLRKSALP